MDRDPRGANADEIDYWNDDAGPRWAAEARRTDAQLAPFAEALIRRADLSPGQQVLDVGCGCAGVTMELARLVGSRGRVVGVDVSRTLLEVARERVRVAGLRQVELREADAQTGRFETGWADRICSRFGVMFFSEPAEAFRNLGRCLAPSGRLTFVCWAAPGDNPWASIPRAAAARVVEIPDPPDEDRPGPFALARPERIDEILVAAGLARPSIEPLAGQLLVGGGGDLESATAFSLRIGAASRAIREAPPDRHPAIAAAVREALAPHCGPDGVGMAYKAWLVTTRARALSA